LNKLEQVKVLDELKAMFPDWEKWVNQLERKQETLRVWCRALESVDHRDVLDIIDEYTTGKRKAPTSYEYERLIFGIVAAAREIRDKDTQRSEQQQRIRSWHDEQDAAAKRRSEYKTIRDRGMGWAAKEFERLVNLRISETGRPRSQWTSDDDSWYREQMAEVVKQVGEMRC
jgi:hypothetical protein